jgi:hypothetical protein
VRPGTVEPPTATKTSNWATVDPPLIDFEKDLGTVDPCAGCAEEDYGTTETHERFVFKPFSNSNDQSTSSWVRKQRSLEA